MPSTVSVVVYENYFIISKEPLAVVSPGGASPRKRSSRADGEKLSVADGDSKQEKSCTCQISGNLQKISSGTLKSLGE